MKQRIQIDIEEKILEKYENLAEQNRSTRKQMIEKAVEEGIDLANRN